MKLSPTISFVIAFSLLGGCTVDRPVVTGRASPLPKAVKIAAADPDGKTSVPSGQLVEALSRALNQRGVVIAADAAFVLNLTLAKRPDTVGVAQETSSPMWLSRAARPHILPACRRQRLRVTIVGRDISAQQPPLLVQGEVGGCGHEAAQIANLANAIAAYMD